MADKRTVPLCQSCGQPMIVGGIGWPESERDDEGTPFWCPGCDAEAVFTGGSVLPAFDVTPYEGDEGETSYTAEPQDGSGVTMRDFFALTALQVLVGDSKGGNPKNASARAYEYADAMLEARRTDTAGNED